jgi:hypothetical protein
MNTIVENPKLKGTNFSLATKDAHSLYAPYGFNPLAQMATALNWQHVYDGHGL